MAALQPGFADPVGEAQAVFRAVLTALSRPGLPRDLPAVLAPPAPLTPELAAVALALADPDAPIWLDPALAGEPAVAAYLRFQTGAPIVSQPGEAALALVRRPEALSDAESFALGTQDYPDRSTTVVLAVECLASSEPVHHPSPLRGGPSRSEAEDRGGGGGGSRAGGFCTSTPTPDEGYAFARPSPQGGGMAREASSRLSLRGPGVKGVASFCASPLPADFVERVAANHALFPRGVDWLLVGGGRVVGLPRSSALSLVPEAEAS